jgi:hypothetical protein
VNWKTSVSSDILESAEEGLTKQFRVIETLISAHQAPIGTAGRRQGNNYFRSNGAKPTITERLDPVSLSTDLIPKIE